MCSCNFDCSHVRMRRATAEVAPVVVRCTYSVHEMYGERSERVLEGLQQATVIAPHWYQHV